MKIISMLLVLTSASFARVDSHAPISVMGDHLHKEGGKMVSIRTMKMKMKNLYHGDSKVSEDDYFDDTSYMMAPKDMEMTMNMYGFMYGLSDKINIALMINTIESEMNMTKKMGRTNMNMSRYSLADTKLNVLYGHINDDDTVLISKAGLSIPTGTHDFKRNDKLIGFPMQTGSGSYGLSYGVVYTKFLKSSSYGVDLNYLYFLNENNEDYKVGNQTVINTWYSYTLSDIVSVNLLYNINARDPYESDVDMPMSAAVDGKSQHGVRQNIKLGLNTFFTQGVLEGHRFAFDYGKPVARDLAGYQLDIDETYTLAWQYAF